MREKITAYNGKEKIIMKNNKLTLASLGLTALSAVVSVISSVVADKNNKRLMREEIAKQLSELANK